MQQPLAIARFSGLMVQLPPVRVAMPALHALMTLRRGRATVPAWHAA